MKLGYLQYSSHILGLMSEGLQSTQGCRRDIPQPYLFVQILGYLLSISLSHSVIPVTINLLVSPGSLACQIHQGLLVKVFQMNNGTYRATIVL